jgi:hypothetical protein
MAADFWQLVTSAVVLRCQLGSVYFEGSLEKIATLLAYSDHMRWSRF